MTKKSQAFYFRKILIPAIAVFLAISCRKEETPGKIMFVFEHKVTGSNLSKDSLIYTNAAGNVYEVSELQYFISGISFWKGGIAHPIEAENGIHYVDIDIPATLNWAPDQELPAGSYDSLSLVFGITEAKNKSGVFVNPPERDMFWPDMMGGGYHYLKMNGKWKTHTGAIEPFNMHLGIGMVTDSSGNESFVQNYFTVTRKLDQCYVNGSQLYRNLHIVMDINSWFETPYQWDWNITGGQIMQYQVLMQLAAGNGKDAFSIWYESAEPK